MLAVKSYLTIYFQYSRGLSGVAKGVRFLAADRRDLRFRRYRRPAYRPSTFSGANPRAGFKRNACGHKRFRTADWIGGPDRLGPGATKGQQGFDRRTRHPELKL